jgi:LacI family transcriptional regulator
MLSGIHDYCRQHVDWDLGWYLGDAPHWLEFTSSGPVDGVICHVHSGEYHRHLAALQVPVVNVSNRLEEVSFPTVIIDDVRAGELAAEHLLSARYPSFACVSWAHFRFGRERVEGFRRRLRGDGQDASCLVFRGDADPWAVSQLSDWLNELSKPVAIFAVDDALGYQIIQVCQQRRLAIPNDVAVISANNDEEICRWAAPALSSIHLPSDAVGWQAAATLDRMMRGELVGDVARIAPTRVVGRASTNRLVVNDPVLQRVLEYMRTHVHTGINVADVLRAVPMGRRTLERKFQEQLGRTPHQVLLRLRVDRVKELLSDTDLSVAEIAWEVGFATPEHVTAVLRRTEGVSPTAFRDKLKPKHPSEGAGRLRKRAEGKR